MLIGYGLVGTVVCCDPTDPELTILVTWDNLTGAGGHEQCQWCAQPYTCDFPEGSAFWVGCSDIARVDDLGCGAPGTGSCQVANGSPYCEDEACCQAVCAVDPYCCDVDWDTLCADTAATICAPGGCGAPGTGSCQVANGSPYCEDEACCQAVCAVDPYCCDVEWDTLCADLAGQFPSECGEPTCTPDFIVTGPGTWTGNTCGAGNDCPLLSSPEHVYEVTLAEAAEWRFSLCDSSYDTFLLVGTTPGGFEVGFNDDACGLQSELTAVLDPGTYYVTVEGYGGSCGSYVLTIDTIACDPPSAPWGPVPADGAVGVGLEGSLCWNGGVPETLTASPKIIYGADDRLDEYEVFDAALRAAGDSTVALVSVSSLTNNGNGTYTLPSETFAQYYLATRGRPLCSDERFRDQPNPAFCSGFLVAPDIVATAGHCISNSNCGSVAFVFGFVMTNPTTPALTVPASDVYFCTDVIRREVAAADWGLVRLDRPVTGHAPLPVRSAGIVPNAEPLLVIGHPVGLPRKYAGGATVRNNSPADYFEANLDTYGGNSGSAVFSANTLQVEGILVRGWPDFVQDGACDRSNVCPDTGCPGWEDVTRATTFSSLIPSYDVYLGECGGAMEYQGTTVDTCWPLPPLLAGKNYCWYVVAHNHCPDGQTQGPDWSFNTGDSPAADFDRDGDVDQDDVDIFRFCATGADVPYDPNNLPPGCTLVPDGDGIIAADFDRDGDVDMDDFATLQRCISGEGIPADPDCAQ